MEVQTENAFQILDEQVFYGFKIQKKSVNLIHSQSTLNKSNLFLTLALRNNHFQGKPQPEQKSRDNVLKKYIFLPKLRYHL